MKLSGLHLLWTYRCIYECDHCFVWGSPRQTGTMTLRDLRRILAAAAEVGTLEWIYFEGGESCVYYTVSLRGAPRAGEAGFKVGVVSNAYWATDLPDALEWLTPFRGLVDDLSISRDPYHGSETSDRQAQHAVAAAEQLEIPVATIRIAEPEAMRRVAETDKPPAGQYALRYRGRAAEQLVGRAELRPWTEFTECPGEELRDPDRVHVDPEGHVHICQGVTVGNLFDTPLKTICESFDPDSHPVIGPLLEGGPAELVRRYGLPHADAYADACHLCYEARRALRSRFPEVLGPDPMYGVPED
jgi:hypothetical protein